MGVYGYYIIIALVCAAELLRGFFRAPRDRARGMVIGANKIRAFVNFAVYSSCLFSVRQYYWWHRRTAPRTPLSPPPRRSTASRQSLRMKRIYVQATAQNHTPRALAVIAKARRTPILHRCTNTLHCSKWIRLRNFSYHP